MTIYLGDRWQPFEATRVTEISDNSTGTDGGTVEDVTSSFDQATLNDNFAALVEGQNRIMDALITAGLMAGDALAAAVVDESVGITEVAVDKLN